MDGILVVTDQSQEWMLEWWWEHYHQTNTFPDTEKTFIYYFASQSGKSALLKNLQITRAS